MQKSPGLKPFPKIANSKIPYRLEWIGGVTPNSGDYSSSLLNCHFTPLSYGKDNTLERNFREQIKDTIAIGYLPALCVGSIFPQNILKPGFQLARREEELHITIDNSDQSAITETSLRIIKPKIFPVLNIFNESLDSGLKMLSARLIPKDKQDGGRSEARSTHIKVCIPEIEIMRFYYMSSEWISKKIFQGEFSRNDWKDRFFSESHESDPTSICSETGAARLVHKLGPSKANIPILARIRFDTSEYSLKAVQRIHNSIVSQRLNTEAISYPRTHFPFKGKATLHVKVAWMPVKNVDSSTTARPLLWFFRVNQILSCDSAFPFTHISYCCEVSPGGDPADSNAPVAFPGKDKI